MTIIITILLLRHYSIMKKHGLDIEALKNGKSVLGIKKIIEQNETDEGVKHLKKALKIIKLYPVAIFTDFITLVSTILLIVTLSFYFQMASSVSNTLTWISDAKDKVEEEVEELKSKWTWEAIPDLVDNIIGGGEEPPGEIAPIGGFVKGHATGPYAVTLDDGTHYWYHQNGGFGNCSCVNCGDWSNAYWKGGESKGRAFGSDGCAIYSLAIGLSNITGREITPNTVLTSLGCTKISNTWTTNQTYFAGVGIKRDQAVKKLAADYGVNVEPVEHTIGSIDNILARGGVVWGSWVDAKSPWCGNGTSHFMCIRKTDGTNYYCYTSCRGKCASSGGKNGAIQTMNHPVPKAQVISQMTGGQLYGFWVNGTAQQNTDVYQALLAAGYPQDKAYAMSVAYGATEPKYGRNFAIGMMANIAHEGKFGQLEYKSKAGYWSQANAQILALQGKVISSREMAETWFNNVPNVSGFGVGAIQWSSPGRRTGILNSYLAKATSYSQEDLGAIEVAYMVSELSGGYASVPASCVGKSSAECASTICSMYEKPDKTSYRAGIRAQTAAKLDQILGVTQ